MRATTFILAAALAGFAAADTSSTDAVTATVTESTVPPPATSAASVSGCGEAIDLIIASCLTTETTQLNACKPNDWDCMCEQQTNVVTCYNNCPSDPAAFGAQQTQLSYCNAAKAYGSTSSTVSTMSATSSTSSGTTASGTETGSSTDSGFSQGTTSTATGTSTSSTASPTTQGSGADVVAAPVGVLAAALGLLMLL